MGNCTGIPPPYSQGSFKLPMDLLIEDEEGDCDDHSSVTMEDFTALRMSKQNRVKTMADEERERKRLIKMEAALQNNLRENALPMILMAHSDDENDNSSIDDLTPRTPRSGSLDLDNGVTASPISQSRKRRKKQRQKILEAANKSNKWLLFHDMDLFDDDEIHIVKLFLDIVMHRVPGTFWSEEESLTYETELEKVALSRENSFESLIAARRAESIESPSGNTSNASSPRDETSSLTGFSSQRRSPSLENRTPLSKRLTEAASISTAPTPSVLDGDVHKFMLPPGNNVSFNDAMDIISVYRHENGKLDITAVHKLLRLSYRMLKEAPNVNHVDLKGSESLIVVGDLHGQLGDLLHILDEAGLPSEQNGVKYVFNGDFVDRGNHSTEVMCVLLALYIAQPENVILNRGNHEDFAICCAYGFQRECCDKYGEVTFGMFCELFRQLPLFAVVNKSVLILHGGLFRNKEVRMKDLHDIPRQDFSLRDMPDGGETLKAVSSLKRKEYLNQLQRDALWSDPQSKLGYAHNSRGAGVSFGKDIVCVFLRNNTLDMIVRSHECVNRGFELPFIDGPDKPLLCTIFSASNYGGSNDGAYMRFRCEPEEYSKAVRKGKELYFDVFSYNIQKGGHIGAHDELEPVYLEELLFSKQDEIQQLLEEADTERTGEVKSEVWATIMAETTHLKIHWISMVPVLIPDQCVTELGNIKYHEFLSRIKVAPQLQAADSDMASEDGLTDKLSGSAADMSGGHPMINALYTQHKHLETVYGFFDVDNSGAISREHFVSGCELLNLTLNEELQLPQSVGVKSYDELFDLMDIDGTNDVCENSFFELYRIVHTKDRSVDAGVDDEGNVHLGLGEIILHCDSDIEVAHQQERETDGLKRSGSEKLLARETFEDPSGLVLEETDGVIMHLGSKHDHDDNDIGLQFTIN